MHSSQPQEAAFRELRAPRNAICKNQKLTRAPIFYECVINTNWMRHILILEGTCSIMNINCFHPSIIYHSKLAIWDWREIIYITFFILITCIIEELIICPRGIAHSSLSSTLTPPFSFTKSTMSPAARNSSTTSSPTCRSEVSKRAYSKGQYLLSHRAQVARWQVHFRRAWKLDSFSVACAISASPKPLANVLIHFAN